MFTIALREVVAATLLAAAGVGNEAGTQTDASARRLDVMGFRICLGDPTDGLPCDLRLFPPDAEAPPPDTTVPTRWSIFGADICLGEVPPSTACDIHLGGQDQPQAEPQSRAGE